VKLRGTIVFLTGVLAALGAGWAGFPRVIYQTRRQPVDFSHQAHADKAGSKCDDCHVFRADGTFAGVPTLDKCSGCHAAPLYTDRQAHVSAIGDPALELHQAGPLPRFDTPSLLGVWATAPYFHDGSAATLRDTLFSAGFHKMGPAMDDREIDDLVAYLEALP